MNAKQILDNLFANTASRADVAADDSSFVYKQAWPDRIKNVAQRIALEAYLLQIAVEGGLVNQESGEITLFENVIVPYGDNQQLRVFFFRARPKSADEITIPNITARLEPYGVRSKFDANRTTATAEAV